ncbi:DUF3298 and DUF4163 domain-containing protein [Algibacter sp. PT7-4]|uniref:DUF3298 and DUF4163 domain-containing protein n=1 Tax=Algibacter ulvanivorans TaxID=3400999 RepID=UPI003AAADFCD
MRYKHLLFSLCFFAFFNCKEDTTTVFTNVNITSQNNTIVEINIPKATGSNAISNTINTTIHNTVISTLHISNLDNITSLSVEESINAFNNEYTAFKNDFPEAVLPWEAQVDGEIMHQSSNIISIAITSYINTGGAHGNLNITFLNFNAETGKKIENNQLFNNIEGLKKIIKPYFVEATKNKNLLIDNAEFKLPENIGYNENGIVFLYNTYEIAPYTTGIIEFVIPYKDINPYLVFNSF